MRRDLDLARKILLAIEASKDDEPASIRLPMREYDDLHLSHHVRLLMEAGLIHAIETHRIEPGLAWTPHMLTWQGHDFLDAIRDDAVWDKIKAKFADHGGDLPSDIIYEIALDEARRKIGIA